MRERIILIQITILQGLILLFTSCDSTEKDWKNARTDNSIIEYQKFIKKHPAGIHTEEATLALDSLDCINILKTKEVYMLLSFLEKHSSSKYLAKYPEIKESIVWNLAFFSEDTVRYRRFILDYPESKKKEEAQGFIWNIRWAPYKLSYALSMVIHSNGRQNLAGEAFAGILVNEETGEAYMGPEPIGPTIEIWRNFTPKEKIKYSKIGLIPGIAYTKILGEYKLVKWIDLNKSDIELFKEFKIKPYNN